MDLTGATIKPAEGKIAVRFVDDDEGEPGHRPMEPDEPVLATVVAVGAKVPGGLKKGDLVVLDGCSRNCPRLGESLHICDACHLLATVE